MSQAINFILDVQKTMKQRGVGMENSKILGEEMANILLKYSCHIITNVITFPDESVAILNENGKFTLED